MTTVGARGARVRWFSAGVIALAVALGAPLISLGVAQHRILTVLARGLGRNVTVDAVHLRILPYPAIELDGLRVAEDPAFGAEPAILAQSARATPSLAALFTGRLVFARVHLDSASINLVRSPNGAWSLPRLLSPPAAAATGAAPAASAGHAAFPYLDWSDARINLKLGAEKSRWYALSDSGSLAREAGDWRIAAHMQLARSDLSLTDLGDLTVAGRWSAGAAPLRYQVAVRLANSYLAAASALVVGHDAGLHGVLDAAFDVTGSAQQVNLLGTFRAHGLRRWDLIPPPATVSGSVAASYEPARDRLTLLGLGDPAFAHLRVTGVVDNLFTRPQAAFRLDAHALPAAEVLPAALALKAGLAADLKAGGTLDGSAIVAAGPQGWHADGQFTAADLVLHSGVRQLEVPAAELRWRDSSLVMPAAAATLRIASDPARLLQLAASTGPTGFALELRAADWDAPQAAALGRLLGLPTYWPDAVRGSARVQMILHAAWSDPFHPAWQGTAAWHEARFVPEGGATLTLRQATATWNDPRPRRLQFTALAGADSLSGWVEWPAAGSGAAQFNLTGSRAAGAALWQALWPAPTDFLSRMLGSPPPAWLRRLRAGGAVHIADLEWNGFHAMVGFQLRAAPDDWQADALQLQLAGGAFSGRAQLKDGRYAVVGRAEHLDLDRLLRPTPWAGAAQGTLSGAMNLLRPPGGSATDFEADGTFGLRSGVIAGPPSTGFDSLSGAFAVQNGVARLADLHFAAPGQTLVGHGVIHLDRDYVLEFTGEGGPLRLAGLNPQAAAPGEARAFLEALGQIEAQSTAPGPFHDVTLTASGASAWLAGPGRDELPAGVSRVELHSSAGEVTGTAEVDFDRLRSGPPNPLLALFNGRHAVGVRARLLSSAAAGAQLEVMQVTLDGKVAPLAMVDQALRIFVAPRHPGISRRFSVPLPAHVTGIELGDDRVRLLYPR